MLLSIGPLTPKNGGTCIPTQLFHKYLTSKKISYLSVDSSGMVSQKKYIHLYYEIFKLLKLKETKQCIVHVSNRSLIYLFPYVFVLAVIFRVKIFVRFFGGNAYDEYKKKYIYRTICNVFVFNSDRFFVETKSLVKNFGRFSNRVVQWPNSREIYISSKSFSLKHKLPGKYYLFIGTLNESKGAKKLSELAKFSKFPIVFCGSGPEENFIAKQKNILNLGDVDNIYIEELIRKSIAVILPTNYFGEGHPGCLVESIKCGTPFIAFDKGGILDLSFDDSCKVLKQGDWATLTDLLSSGIFENHNKILKKELTKKVDYKTIIMALTPFQRFLVH